jgi:hypothetical protein
MKKVWKATLTTTSFEEQVLLGWVKLVMKSHMPCRIWKNGKPALLGASCMKAIREQYKNQLINENMGFSQSAIHASIGCYMSMNMRFLDDEFVSQKQRRKLTITLLALKRRQKIFSCDLFVHLVRDIFWAIVAATPTKDIADKDDDLELREYRERRRIFWFLGPNPTEEQLQFVNCRFQNKWYFFRHSTLGFITCAEN